MTNRSELLAEFQRLTKDIAQASAGARDAYERSIRSEVRLGYVDSESSPKDSAGSTSPKS